MLQNKVAIITGASQGIGRVLALSFAQAGAAVVLAARSTDKLAAVATEIEAAGGRCLVQQTDVSDYASVEQLADATVAEFGRIDILVNNSGIGGPSRPLWQIETDEWEQTFAVNVRGVFFCCRACLPTMIAQQSGSIITIGSMTGKRPLLNRTPYAASKTALIGLVRTLAWEIGPYNIRANLISPGPVAGDRIEWVINKQAESQQISVDAARRQFTSAAPLDRLVAPRDIANAALFLASDQSASITGEDLNVSAGVVMYS